MEKSKIFSILTLLLLLSSCTLPAGSSDLGTSEGTPPPDESSDSSPQDENTFEDELDNFDNGFSATFTQRMGMISNPTVKSDVIVLDTIVNNDAVNITIRQFGFNPQSSGNSQSFFRGEDDNAYYEILTYENTVIREYSLLGDDERIPFDSLMTNFFKDVGIDDITSNVGDKYYTDRDFSISVASAIVFFISGFNEESIPSFDTMSIESYFTYVNNEITNYTIKLDYETEGMFVELDYTFTSKGYIEVPRIQPFSDSDKIPEYDNLIAQYRDVDNVSSEVRVQNERPEDDFSYPYLNAIIDVYFDGTEIISAKRNFDDYAYNTQIDYYFFREDDMIDLLSLASLYDESAEYDENDVPHYTYYYEKESSFTKRSYDYLFPKFADVSSVFFTRINETTFEAREGYASLIAQQFVPLAVERRLIWTEKLLKNDAELILTFNDDGSIQYEMTYEETVDRYIDDTFTTTETITFQESIKVLYYDFETTTFPQWTQNIELMS